MTNTGLDLRCYVITAGHGREVVETAASAAAGGAGIIQVREKTLGTRDLLGFTLEVARAVRSAKPSTKVVVDDHVDIARAAELREPGLVHGVHLGQDDLPVDLARAMLGPDAIIGLTTGTLQLVDAANDVAEWIDYIGAGPFRPTPTKDSGRPPLGVDGYRPLVEIARRPIVAIGDVQPTDVRDLAATGVAGVALVRAVMGAPDAGAVVGEILAEYAQGASRVR
ncbi:thiamine phosphate synthase [Granulicoccus sp. GXG6511]|uniref:thiamine phosphate synthase n=1 Tax=Granulicoccus sp. GXG6511 TaxID=3381351 RepID=UPI003D7C51B5